MGSLKDRIDAIGGDDELDDNAPIPGTVFNKRQARMLKYLVIFMGFLLIGGFALMIGIIAYRASQPAKPTLPLAPAGISVPGTDLPVRSAPAQRAMESNATANALKTIEGVIPREPPIWAAPLVASASCSLCALAKEVCS